MDYRIRILQEYVDVVILRDIVERHQIGNILPLRYLLRHLLAAPATLFSVNKFHNDLKSQDIACGKNTLRMPSFPGLDRTRADCWKTLYSWSCDAADRASSTIEQRRVLRWIS